MDRQEALNLAEAELESLRSLDYEVLVERFLGSHVHRELVGSTGATYQVEIDASWDSTQPGDLRVIVAIDDGRWRAFAPLSVDFIMAPDGSFVGE